MASFGVAVRKRIYCWKGVNSNVLNAGKEAGIAFLLKKEYNCAIDLESQRRKNMKLAEEKYVLDGKEITLRSAKPEEAQMLIEHLKIVTGETRFLMSEPDEIRFTQKEEEEFINGHNEAKDSMLALAFVDGEYAGNCSFESMAGSRRTGHRAGIGIALSQKYTGFGLGRLMLKRILAKAQEVGFEQVELTVVGNNHRAYRLYESLGFKECGRIPNANKYGDGTYAEDILMALQFK